MVAVLLMNIPGVGALAASPDAVKRQVEQGHGTRLVLLGTAGGVSWFPNTTRASSSSALVVGETIYLIDLGQGSCSRLIEAFNTEPILNGDEYCGSGSSTFLRNVKALFFTHLHNDHVAGYPELLLIGPGAGLGALNPLKVIGPCNRGQLDLNKTGFDESRIVYTDSADPALITPTPGTRQMTELIWQAYAQAINDMMLDNAYPDFRSLVEVTEIGTELTTQGSPTCPVTPPFLIYPEDENGVEVWATLVDHHQVYPSFAFRFNTPDGSVVFSGDTGANTNGNLQALAEGADILVHEVIDTAWVNFKFGTNPPEGSPAYALRQHMLNSHTPVEEVGKVAESCGVKTLVLNHIVPGVMPASRLQQASNGFSGNLIIGEDLMQINLADLVNDSNRSTWSVY
jgi:ribonuclease BN (tRNA processing enzyme)